MSFFGAFNYTREYSQISSGMFWQNIDFQILECYYCSGFKNLNNV